jgi:hypothetical protein
MAKESLETKARKAVLAIKDKVTNIDNVLRDLSMKLCYIIKHKGLGGNYYTLPEGIDY